MFFFGKRKMKKKKKEKTPRIGKSQAGVYDAQDHELFLKQTHMHLFSLATSLIISRVSGSFVVDVATNSTVKSSTLSVTSKLGEVGTRWHTHTGKGRQGEQLYIKKVGTFIRSLVLYPSQCVSE
jgi:hypothetical protein